jgi:hypothetical protein
MTKNIEVFMAGLVDLGYSPIVFSEKPDHVMFEYKVKSGRFAGRQVRLGIVVPTDFPASWPSGPHVSPQIHPLVSAGLHPSGAIHGSSFGTDWQYWSRPLLQTLPGNAPVARYMSHIGRLWDSQ